METLFVTTSDGLRKFEGLSRETVESLLAGLTYNFIPESEYNAAMEDIRSREKL